MRVSGRSRSYRSWRHCCYACTYQRYKPHRRFVVTIHGNGQHPTHLHQGRTHSELRAPPSSSLRNVTIPCCIGSQPVRQVRALISLRDDHPAVYRDFVSGLHVVRRSDRLWAGLSTDLVIEQVLMRSLKASGGLTRGRGFTEQ